MRWLPIIPLVVFVMQTSAAPLPAFEPVKEQLAGLATLRSLMNDVAAERFDEAAAKLETLYTRYLADLMPLDEDGLISVEAMLEEKIKGTQREALTSAYRRAMDASARDALAELQRANARLDRFHELSRRYPLSSSASAASVEAADRALQKGDARAALDLYEGAQSRGWLPDDARLRAIQKARTNLSGASAMSLAFDATWYGRTEHVGSARFFPCFAGGMTYFSGPRHVFAVDGKNQVAWRFATPDAWTHSQEADRDSARGRGPRFTPAIFASHDGKAQILVVRQARRSTLDYALRALRSADGKVLWRTDADGTFANLHFAGDPAIVGSFVYALAIEDGIESMNLTLCALDLLDGRLVFRTTLGAIGASRQRWESSPWWNGLWEQSEPAVAGRFIYIAPNVGVVYCLDRFTGAIRWTRNYHPPAFDGPPADPDQLHRYRGTPVIWGKTAVAAPQDTFGAIGLDVATGRRIWSVDRAAAHTLVGASGDTAVFAGSGICGVDAGTGIIRWRYDPPAPLRITGPPAMADGRIIVPTSDFKLVTLSAETGKPARSNLKHPAIRPFFASEAGKRLFEEAGMSRAFGLPAVGAAPKIP